MVPSLGRRHTPRTFSSETFIISEWLKIISKPNKMPSRSNPNTPSSLKVKTARTIKTKRQNTQRLARNKISKPTPRTSQAMRKAAPLSRKKARKLDKKMGYAKRRAMEKEGEVEMKDVEQAESTRTRDKDTRDEEEMRMEVDDVQ